VAHGDYGVRNKGSIWTAHNGESLQRPLPGYPVLWKYPDEVLLDAWMGPNGRPAGPAILFTADGYDYAIFSIVSGKRE
jgi:hypothetical protein